jgi:hypothetical protein
MKKIILVIVAAIGLETTTIAQNICQSIGNDSLALLTNGYITGPNSGGGTCTGLNVHTESKWINVTGADSLFVNTFQHRLYDFSKIYDKNNNLIWSWLGENASATWYFRSHSVFVGGNDSVRIEFHQGYSDPFCNGYLQIVGMHCNNLTTNITVNTNDKKIIKIYPNPTNGLFTIDYGNHSILTGYNLKIMNSLGQQVYTTHLKQQSSIIDLNGLASKGIYFAHIIDGKGNTIDIKKIVLQ